MIELDRFYTCDCLEFMTEMPDNFVNVVVTSAPYNKNGFRGFRIPPGTKEDGRWVGSDIKYGQYMDDMDEDKYKEWQIKVLNELYRIVTPDGSVFYNHKVRRAGGEASHPMEWILKTKFKFYQQIIWDRGGSPDNNLGYLLPNTELIFWLTKDYPKVYQKNKGFHGEIWRLNPDIGNNHPAPFPLRLADECISLTTKEVDIVFDPFSGSGTTCLAAEILQRRWLGVDLNLEYVKMGELRLAEYRSQLKLF